MIDDSTMLVLILVLMEYGLRERLLSPDDLYGSRLNPCFNGIWSARVSYREFWEIGFESLNPCFNGIWSARVKSMKICM